MYCVQEAERESIEMQMKHEKTQEEKERLLNSLVEAESVTVPMMNTYL